MNNLVPTIIKWGARAHLVGVGVVLGYGLNHGDLTAAYDHVAVAVLANPFVVGASIGFAGWAKMFVAAPVTNTEASNTNEGMDLDDESSDILDDDMAIDSEFELEDMDYVDYETYGHF